MIMITVPSIIQRCSRGCGAYITSDDVYHLHFNNKCINNKDNGHEYELLQYNLVPVKQCFVYVLSARIHKYQILIVSA